jgi:prepilin signal peptidase PulO-like enzyme (type II secretory pathway)
VVIGFIHIFVSQALRGKSMPVDAVVYTTVFTLIIFLLFKIPVIWQGVDFSKGDAKSNKSAGSAAAILLGLMTLTIQYMMASTHTWDGVNFANVFNTSLTLIGGGLILAGLGLFVSWEKVWRTAGKLQSQY